MRWEIGREGGARKVMAYALSLTRSSPDASVHSLAADKRSPDRYAPPWVHPKDGTSPAVTETRPGATRP